MIGVFDSGAGGLLALTHLRKLCPNADLCFYADRENAPYGTKSEEELVFLVEKDVLRLKNAGAEKILMACCTASTVWHLLKNEHKEICCPIISPTASAALIATKNKKIGVIATERTVKTKCFSKAIKNLDKTAEITELAAQPLVKMAENGIFEEEEAKRILDPLVNSEIDTLLLGCTHFPIFENEIAKILPGVKLISSAYEGAKYISTKTRNEGRGTTRFL